MESISTLGNSCGCQSLKLAHLSLFFHWPGNGNSIAKPSYLNTMILQFFFRQLSAEKQVSYLQKNGVSLGSRAKNGRRIYVYMVRNMFVEVIYENDDANSIPEKVNLLKGLKNLNAYLEKEFRASF
jgi:hypothetical protein